jgi:hypothetical protein
MIPVVSILKGCLIIAEGTGPLGALLGLIPLFLVLGAMVWGFKIASRRVENVFYQLLLGGVIGFGIIIGAVCVLFGILFAGCLITGAPSFH